VSATREEGEIPYRGYLLQQRDPGGILINSLSLLVVVAVASNGAPRPQTMFPRAASGVPESDGVRNPTPLCGFSSASLALRRAAASSDATNGQMALCLHGLNVRPGVTPAGGGRFAHVPSTARRLSSPTSVYVSGKPSREQ
jgi:hypothetical protein